MRKFITADAVRLLAKDSNGKRPSLIVEKDDIVTAEAYDLARTLGVNIITGSPRRPLVCANFKMNGGIGFLDKYIIELSAFLAQHFNTYKDEMDVVIAPPAPLVALASGMMSKTQAFYVGGQNAYLKETGAFTGETSPWLLKECGAQYVILGHSERRSIFGETNGMLSSKLKAAIDAGLEPIFCVGENLSERNSNKTKEILKNMLSSLYSIPIEYSKKVIIAYEPVWAIGTGNNATNSQIEEVAAFIRADITENIGVDFARNIRILYGGSVNDVNSLEIAQINGIDGALVGGASLKAQAFGKIVTNFRIAKR